MAPETPAPETPAPEKRAPTRAHTTFTTILAVALVVVLALGGWLWWQDRETDQAPAVLSQARVAAEAFFTLDWTDVDHDIDRMLALSTGSFRSSYRSQRTSLAQGVEAKKVTISSTVPDSGTALEYLSGHDAQVLVAVNATTRLASGGTESTSYRTRVRLTLVGKRWLVSGLEQVG